MPLLQNILLWQSLAMLHKLEVCFDQPRWAVKYRFGADPWGLAGEQLLEFGGQKPERVAGTGLGLPVPVRLHLMEERVHAWRGKERSAMSLLSAGTTAVPQGPACTLISFSSSVKAIYLYKPCCSHLQHSAEKNKTKAMGRVQHMELGQQMLVCKCHFM